MYYFALVVITIISLITWGNTEELKTAAITFGVLLFLGFVPIGLFSYYANSRDVKVLQRKYDLDIPNSLQFLRNLNANVIISSKNENLIIDVANAGQSAKNTEEWKDLLKQINKYNEDFMGEQFMRDNPINGFMVNGFFPSSLGNLKFIKFNEIK